MKLKEIIFNTIIESLDTKSNKARQTIEYIKESRNKDTKSSAGDKFETGREMMQIEINKNEAVLAELVNLKNLLSKMVLQKDYKKVEFGTIVYTNRGNYFISIAHRKIELDGISYFPISLVSPIGKILYHKVINDKFNFQGREFLIENIV